MYLYHCMISWLIDWWMDWQSDRFKIELQNGDKSHRNSSADIALWCHHTLVAYKYKALGY
jgi:hypothetical protein